MSTSSLLSTLAHCLRCSDVLRFRDAAEREYLERWLSQGFATTVEVQPLSAQVSQEGDIRALIASCALCRGTGERKMPFGDGSGGLVVVLNPPALLSSIEMNSFKKESSDILLKILKNALGIEPSSAYITNLLKCTLKEAMRPSDFYENCLPLLQKEIEFIDPKTVLVMGDMLPLRRVRKNFPNCNWFEIPHPVVMIQTPELKRQAWETLKLVKSTLYE